MTSSSAPPAASRMPAMLAKAWCACSSALSGNTFDTESIPATPELISVEPTIAAFGIGAACCKWSRWIVRRLGIGRFGSQPRLKNSRTVDSHRVVIEHEVLLSATEPLDCFDDWPKV